MARTDSGFALLASLLCTAHGIKGTDGQRLSQKDFMPYPISESQNEFTPEKALLMFSSLASKSKAAKKRKKA